MCTPACKAAGLCNARTALPDPVVPLVVLLPAQPLVLLPALRLVLLLSALRLVLLLALLLGLRASEPVAPRAPVAAVAAEAEVVVTWLPQAWSTREALAGPPALKEAASGNPGARKPTGLLRALQALPRPLPAAQGSAPLRA